MAVSNKHIVITGGASGLGLEMVRQLAAANRISVIARPSRKLENFREEFPDIDIYDADMSDLPAVEKAIDKLVKANDVIDILINNAAVQYTPSFLDEDFCYAHIRREIDVNFTSICSMIYLALPALLGSKQAIILNINSGLGLVPKTSSAIYCATKGAMNILSQSLRHQFEDTNIQVKQAFLPLVDTPMTAGRGTGKISAEKAASDIIAGMASARPDIDIGKVKILRPLARFIPVLARKIMKAG